MRLSGIKLAGFKSFVDPTQLPLPSNLNGIVGPNGCGKSNLIDAVRWVLGETSIKTLRGQDSDDVIFNGSRTRKPVGRASVELVFDNSDGQTQGPFAAYNEIAVRRELTRDGHSQYFLNNRKCLKRDVTDLFLGTGLGSRNQYAIIEQGMVSRMVEARPEDLRTWLEEASGISRYKERRRDTETRIRQTRENLDRLNDLRGELDKRLEVLRRQAANAEKYRSLKTEERLLRAGILALKLAALDTAAAAQQQALERLQLALAEAQQRHADEDAARETAEIARAAEQEAFGQAQEALYTAEAELAQADQALSHARQLRALKEQDLQQLLRQLAELDRREDSERRRSIQLTEDIGQLEARRGHALEAEQQARERFVELDELLQEAQLQWEDFQARSEQPLLRAEGERVRVAGLQRAAQQLGERQQRLHGERDGLDAEPLRQALERAGLGAAEAGAQLQQASTELQEQDTRLASLREARSALEQRLHEQRQQLQSARGRLASLETLQQAAMRQDDAELQRWLAQRGLKDAPRLADRLGTAEGWEAALEALLAGWLSAPLAQDAAALTALSATAAPAGGLRLLSSEPAATPTPPSATTPLPRLTDQLQAPQAVHDLLAGILLADSPEQAARQCADLATGQAILCPDGSLRGRHWLRLPRRGDAHSGVLTRAPQIAALRADVDTLQAAVTAGEAELAELRQQQQSGEQQRRATAQRLDVIRSRHSQQQAECNSLAMRLEQLDARIQRLDQDIAALDAEAQRTAAEHAAAAAALSALEAAAATLRSERQLRQQQLTQLRDSVSSARATHGQTTQALSQIQVQLAGRSSALQAQQQTLADIAEARAHLAEEQTQRAAQAAELDAPLAQQEDAVEDARNRVELRRDAARRRRGQLEAVEAAQAQAQLRLRGSEQQRDAAREALQNAQLAAEGLRSRREALAEQAAQASAEAGAEVADIQAETGTDLDAAEQRLVQLLKRVERLGAINLAAIDELTEAETRAGYLTDQHADLFGALEALETAIRKIDGETRERFKDTFERVNTVFRDRFPKLFGGGEAWLELTGDNLLDSGVKVIARPPGKRNSSVQLLSGGEKAMTAVALLLALFQLNPAPFCLMDEVDAPLDDANVSRFCATIQEMSVNVQFIIITHNKITMELATHLLGVTMQEPGVSRLVSVDIEQALDLAGPPPTSNRVTA